jgi:hypothetical protein
MSEEACVCTTKNGRLYPCLEHERRTPPDLDPDTKENFRLWMERNDIWFSKEKAKALEIIKMVKGHDAELAERLLKNVYTFEDCVCRMRFLMMEKP